MFNVREITTKDVDLLLDYWYSRSDDQLIKMGANPSKMPSREVFRINILNQLSLNYKLKKAYATIWLYNGIPIGHNNINKIAFGQEAYMHLHIWDVENRLKGLGQKLIKKSIALFFKNFNLQILFCEPYSKNPAPNKLLRKLGFTFMKKYSTIPGSINFKQEVNRWALSKEKFDTLKWI